MLGGGWGRPGAVGHRLPSEPAPAPVDHGPAQVADAAVGVVEAAPPVEPGEGVLDDVLGRAPVAHDERGQPDQLAVAALEQILDEGVVRRLARLGVHDVHHHPHPRGRRAIG